MSIIFHLRLFLYTACEGVKLLALLLIVWEHLTGSWRKLHNKELHNLYSSPSIIRMIKSRRMRWAWHVARMGEKRNILTIPTPRPRRRWVDNIKMDVREIRWDGVDWIDMAHDRDQWRALVNTGLKLRVP
jgi:hypothetical protein